MPSPRECRPPALLLLLLLTLAPLAAQAAPPATSAPAAAPLPDYGGRDAPGVPADVGAGTASPAAQAGRTLGSLVVVLAGVVGVVFLLKRAGFVGGDPATALRGGALRRPVPPAPSSALAVTHSQPLPGGGTLHLVSAHDRTLLVGATAQSVTLLAEWELESAPPSPDAARAEDAAFADYLARAGAAPPDRAAARAAGERVAGAAGRLQDLLARAQSPDETPQ